MYNAEKLSAMNVKELQEEADKNKIKYTSKSKKQDLINLILEHNKVSETISEKKQQLKGSNDSSGANSGTVAKKSETKGNPDFNNTPEIPNHYGRNKIVFLVRDPFWGYAYWELSSSLVNEHSLQTTEKYLRIYDITETDNPDSPSGYFDIRLNNEASSWYIKFPQANRTFIIDFGYFKDGVFITLLRSNKAATPRDDVSDQVDVEWMTSDIDFNKLLQASGGDKLFERIGSQELMKFIASNVNEENSMFSGNMGLTISSGGLNLSSMSSSSLASGSGRI
ncbi:MAG: hypothetical protein A2015_00515 [Spirochaetes bacterium GWF1_31_7]|nr:MAG: hypothetical protein A2Y30_03995 [Spirochaetes bacterium GWE1_32_154]OHD45156.1 MAG: hypothetical protein A2Y29_15900 [Spirochaetes bacterium GWE2_31_10]OHD51065.1 MAG: hypothetical protein A2015_00515 [Spirochaetes bacterium GWF1_31_7]OHD83430.1 MAG: hypothetical protein A2355_01530 [Spirochaetes bacterium RIFOXYB1_FULL_32_8]HBD94389.1 hypothetical protein [Spirochaetia bacterium]